MDALVRPPKANAGDRVAVLSPAGDAPAHFPAIHEQGLRRLQETTGLVPVEFPTTRRAGAPARERADDVNAAFADPSIRAIIATIGGEDQITVVPHLDPSLVRADPKPFMGTSDNTNMHSWLWVHGIASFYGGSTQVHLGPGPAVDDVHARSLRAALLTGETLEVTEPGESEDTGLPWDDPGALIRYGERELTEPWAWAGPRRVVSGPTWGGCLEVIQWVLAADRFAPPNESCEGAVLLLEASEELTPAREVGWIIRSIGERGLLERFAAVLLARTPTSDFTRRPDPVERGRLRAEQRDTAVQIIQAYNPDAVVVVGVPFGHTRPQWILPHGGVVTVDGTARRIFANYQ